MSHHLLSAIVKAGCAAHRGDATVLQRAAIRAGSLADAVMGNADTREEGEAQVAIGFAVASAHRQVKLDARTGNRVTIRFGLGRLGVGTRAADDTASSQEQ